MNSKRPILPKISQKLGKKSEKSLFLPNFAPLYSSNSAFFSHIRNITAVLSGIWRRQAQNRWQIRYKAGQKLLIVPKIGEKLGTIGEKTLIVPKLGEKLGTTGQKTLIVPKMGEKLGTTGQKSPIVPKIGEKLGTIGQKLQFVPKIRHIEA